MVISATLRHLHADVISQQQWLGTATMRGARSVKYADAKTRGCVFAHPFDGTAHGRPATPLALKICMCCCEGRRSLFNSGNRMRDISMSSSNQNALTQVELMHAGTFDARRTHKNMILCFSLQR